MKTLALLFIITFTACFFQFCRVYEHQINDVIFAVTPRGFTIENTKIQTVSSLTPEFIPSTSLDNIEMLSNKFFLYKPKAFEINDSDFLKDFRFGFTSWKRK